jgi:hypothetical protein
VGEVGGVQDDTALCTDGLSVAVVDVGRGVQTQAAVPVVLSGSGPVVEVDFTPFAQLRG